MTEIALLAAFCGAMGAIATAKFLLADERDPVDAGVILIVWGITTLAAIWAALEGGLLSVGAGLLLGAVGLVLLGGGILVVTIYWHRPPRSARLGGTRKPTEEETDPTECDSP